MTTLEEARRCPRCEQLGTSAGSKPAPERWMGTLHLYKCENKRCARYEGVWVVQVRPDGTIPEPTLHREKSFPAMDGMSARDRIARARANVDRTVNESLGR